MPWSNDSDLANYIFLMQRQDSSLPDSTEYILVRFTLVGIGLSIVGSLLSVFLVCYVPIRSDALFSICNMCIALIGAQLAFAGAENAFPQKVLCKISTASLHFLFLAVHCWSLSFSLHLLQKLFRFLHGKRGRRRFMLVMIGWVAPMIVVATTAVLAGDGYGDYQLCWLSVDNGSRWAFIGPVCFICGVNLIVFFGVCVVQVKHDIRKALPVTSRVKNVLAACITHIPVSNVTWLIGLVPVKYTLFQYLFVILNASQGMFIFLLHMMCSGQIRSMLRTRLNPGGPGEEGKVKREEELSKSGSTGNTNTQSEEMEVEGLGMKTIASSKHTAQ